MSEYKTESNYVASPTMSRFHKSDDLVRALMGPLGSGKSVACTMDMMIRSMQQKPNQNGYRKTRWVIVRNTYRELMDTTVKTFFDWIPERLGLMKKMDMTFILDIPLPDSTTLYVEFLFRALDKPQDVKKLLSLELTGGWLNEAREIPKSILDALTGRISRYPSVSDGGCTWSGIIMDTNPPDSDHWWYKLFEVDKPDKFSLYKQPSGLDPEAENRDNLKDTYYEDISLGKDKEWINVYVHGTYGFVQDGKPIFPEYKDNVHSTAESIAISDRLTIYVGIDFGLTPAAVFGQESASGRWLIFDELVAEDMGASNFAKMLNKKINKEYSGYTFEIYGDPAGEQRAQTDEVTPFQILQKEGITAWPTYTNDVVIRREACAAPMQRMDFAGNTGFIIGPKAPMIRKALAGGYKYKRMQISGSERFQDKPDKNRYSHVADALQYLMVGAGEGNKLITNETWAKPIKYSNKGIV